MTVVFTTSVRLLNSAEQRASGSEASQKQAQPPGADPAKPQPDAPKTAPATDGQTGLITRAREKLASYRSIQADVLETMAIGSRQFKATGRYLQGPDDKLRIEFSVQIGKDTKGSLVQVCNGHHLWTRWNLGKNSRITRRDVQEIRRTIRRQRPSVLDARLLADLGLGGVKSLMAALEQSMDFAKAREMSIDGKAFYVVVGTWNKETLGVFGSDPSQEEAVLPEHIPDSVRVYLQQDNLFPRRIMYLKKHPEKSLVRPLVTLDFVRIKLNPPLNEAEFDFEPPDDVPQVDDTKKFLERLLSVPAGQETTAPD
ncbi:MAG: hypothetical protein ABGZ17_17940 [Planctomycetaceae bacterium]